MLSRSPASGRARALAAACAIALGAGAARAVEANAPTTTEEEGATPTPTRTATATSTPPPTSGVGDTGAVEEIVVVGRRPRGQVAQDPTAAATVVEADRFAGEAKGVAELVATAPGVAVSGYGGLGQLSTVGIRGSTAAGVLVLVDGLPLNTAAGGGVDLSTIPRAWVSRIEIARGAEGAHYGVGALGGVVNVVTRSANGEAWSAEVSGGSFETFSASAAGAARAGRWSVLAQASADATDGDFGFEGDRLANIGLTASEVRANNGSLRAGALLKATGRLGEGRADALAQVTFGWRELAGWRPPTPDDWQRDGRAVLVARAAAPGPGGLVLAGRGHVRADLLDLGLEGVFGGRVTRQRGGAAGLAGDAVWSHRQGALRASASAEGETLSSSALGGTHVRASLSASASEELSALGDRLRISPAVRIDRVGPFSGFSGKLGASLRLSHALAARASAGRTFRAPSLAELLMQQGLVMPNPDLRSEEGVGADAGLVFDGALGLATVGGFATLYDDLIQYEATFGGRLKPRNVGKARVAGLEAEAATSPLRVAAGLALSASYTLLATEDLRGPPEEVGREVPFKPRHRLYARVAVAPGPATAHLEAHWVSAQFEDARNVNRMPSTLAWNAGASIRVSRRPELHAAVEVRNLLDDRTLREPLGGPLPGRAVMITVRASPTLPEGRP